MLYRSWPFDVLGEVDTACKGPCLPVPGPIPRAGSLRIALLAVASRRCRCFRCLSRQLAPLPPLLRHLSLRWRGNRPSIMGTSARAARERGTAIGFFVVASGAWCRKATAAIGTAGRAPWGLAERSECVARWQSSGAVHWKMSSDVRGQEQRPGEGIGGSDRRPQRSTDADSSRAP